MRVPLVLLSCLLSVPAGAEALTGKNTGVDWLKASIPERLAWAQFAASKLDEATTPKARLAVGIHGCLNGALTDKGGGPAPTVDNMSLADLTATCGLLMEQHFAKGGR